MQIDTLLQAVKDGKMDIQEAKELLARALMRSWGLQNWIPTEPFAPVLPKLSTVKIKPMTFSLRFSLAYLVTMAK